MDKAPKELFIADRRMLEVLDFCISRGLGGIETQYAWCERIGLEKTNLRNVRLGDRGFTTRQILACATAFGIDVNWLFGFSDVMFRETASLNPLQQLEAAAAAIRLFFDKNPDGITQKAMAASKPKAAPKAASRVGKGRAKAAEPTPNPAANRNKNSPKRG